MLKRFKWITYGAVIGAIGVSGGTLMVGSHRQRAESLRRENQKLAREREALVRRNEELAEERRQLAKVVERLNVERRVANVEVLQQHTDESGVTIQTVLRLTEIGRDGEPLAAQVFGIPGRVPHFDALVIKFDEEFVARGDELRGHSLALFRRIYGETQPPESGYWLGSQGDVPDIYRVSSTPSEFELRLWREFWSYATEPEKARRAGIRVAQGEAVYAPMRTGEAWLLTLEADGGLNLIKQDETTAAPDTLAGADSPSALEATLSQGGPSRLRAPSPLKAGATAD